MSGDLHSRPLDTALLAAKLGLEEASAQGASTAELRGLRSGTRVEVSVQQTPEQFVNGVFGPQITYAHTAEDETSERFELELEHRLDLLVQLATVDLVGMRALMALPGAKEGRGLDDKVVVTVRVPTLVEFYPERDAKTVQVRARAPIDGMPEFGPVSCAERDSIESHFGLTQLPQGRLANATLSVDRRGIWLSWLKEIDDVSVLEEAVRLLVLLSSPRTTGAYR